MRKIKLCIIVLCLFSPSCSENGGEGLEFASVSMNGVALPFYLSALDEGNLKAILTVYDPSLAINYQAAMTIKDGSVYSVPITLKKELSYTFVISFYYSLEGESLGLSYVLLTQTVSDKTVSISYSSADFVIDMPDSVDNNLSPTFSLSGIDLPNLDSDGDGVSNLREIFSGLDPLKSPEADDDDSDEAVADQTTATTPATETPATTAEVPVAEEEEEELSAQNHAPVFFQHTTSTLQELDEQGGVWLSWVGYDIDDGDAITSTVTVYAGGTCSGDVVYTDDLADMFVNVLGLSQGTVYSYAVVLDDGVDQTTSPCQSFQTAADVVVPNKPPVFLEHDTTDAVQDPTAADGVTLSWDAIDFDSSDAITSTVTVYAGADCDSGNVVTTLMTPESNMSIPGLSERRVYSYTVTVDDGEDTDESDCRVFRTGAVDLLAWWAFDDGSGDSVRDLTENDFDGVLTYDNVGYPAWSEEAVVGTALEFDALDGHVTVDSSFDELGNFFADAGGRYIEAWVYIGTTGAKDANGNACSSRIFERSSATSTEGWMLSSFGFDHGFSNKDGNWAIIGDGTKSNQWNHIALGYDGTSPNNWPEFYINGVRVGLTRASAPEGTIDPDAAYDLHIGAAADGNCVFDGYIDEVIALDKMPEAVDVRSYCLQHDPAGVCADDDVPYLVSPEPANTGITAGTMTLTWSGGDSSVNHYVLCYTSSGLNYLDGDLECENEKKVQGATSYGISTTGGKSYWWKVKACADSKGEACSDYTPVWNFYVSL